MTTRFSVHIEAPEEETDRIRAVAEEIFEEIRRLESLFSRFIEDSDISRVNRLRHGESVVISPETYRCLALALEAEQQTGGHFNVAYHSLLTDETGKAFSLLTNPCRVQSETTSLHLDLGGIGKGFALDHVREILETYDYSRSMICADTSTVLALFPPQQSQGWPVVVETADGSQTLFLAHSAVGCSGKSVRGEHIFDTQRKIFDTTTNRVWVQNKSATFADAFSTAMMTMSDDERTEFMKKRSFPT